MKKKAEILENARLPWRIHSMLCLLFAATAFPGAARAFPDQANADDLTAIPIENLLNMEVYSASRFVQNISDAPSAVSVLTATEIKTFGWRTLAEALRSLLGLYVSYDRNYSYLGARGFSRSGDYNPRFLLMVDGKRINDPIYDQAAIGSEFVLDIDLVERIEYVPGPGSSIYGSNAFFGVVNIITRRGRDFKGLEVSGEAGSYGARKGRMSYGLQNENGAELLISATGFNKNGTDFFFQEYSTDNNHGVAQGLDYERGQQLFLKGAAGPFNFSLAHSERNKGTPTASYGQVFNAPGSKVVDEQTLVDFGYRKSLAPQADLSTRFYFNNYKFLGNYIYSNAGGSPALTVNQDESASNWWGGEAKLVTTQLDGHKLVAGVEYQKSSPIEQTNFYIDPYVSQLNSRRHNSRAGMYVQDELQLSADLMLSMGLRYDHNSANAQHVANPRLGLIYQLSAATTFKTLYGTAYRLPNAYELYYQLPGAGGQKINPDLQTEHIRSYEMVLDHQIARDSRIRLSAYVNKVTDLIKLVQDPADNLYVFQNIDQATAKGIEIVLEKAWKSGSRLRTSYTWQQTRDDSTGATLENSPSHLGKLNYSIPFHHDIWRAGFEALYVSKRNTMNSQTGGYLLGNLTLFSDRLLKNVQISASVYNLFNRRYSDPVGEELRQEAIAQDGRNVRLKLTYSY